jgi:hypothetical protein
MSWIVTVAPGVTAQQTIHPVRWGIGICPPRISHPFMETASKQSSPFMKMVVQPCLTACTTASYGLWKWLASSSPHLWKWLCNHVLQLVQLRLTVYGNGWQAVLPVYGNGWQAVLPFMEMVLEVVRAKISGYIKN